MKLSKFFSSREMLRGNDGLTIGDLTGRLYATLKKTAATLDIIRIRFGRIQIVSGYRSRRTNRRAGGARRSTHMKGIAADIRFLDAPRRTWVAKFDKLDAMMESGELPQGGLLFYAHMDPRDPEEHGRPRFVHVDFRGKKVRPWNISRFFGGRKYRKMLAAARAWSRIN